jgi:hypothetical protein
MKRVEVRVPLPGETAVITGEANAVYGNHNLTFLVETVEPSSVDRSRGRTVATAVWLHLTGWSVGPGGRRGRHQMLPVLRKGIRTIVTVPEAPAPRHLSLPRCG